MDYIIINGELYHHGVKGQKWGVRRNRHKSGKKRNKKTKDAAHPSHVRAYSKKAKSMSDAELRNAINRLQMERQYSTLTKREKSAGQKWVQSLLSESAKEVTKKYLVKYTVKGIDAVIAKGASYAAK